MTWIDIVVVVVFVGGPALLSVTRIRARRRRRRRLAQFVTLTAERRATFSESSEKHIGGTAPPGAQVALTLHRRNGRPPEGPR